MAQRRGICPQVVWQHSSAQIVVRDKENRVFYLNLVYELYNDNKSCPCMHNPPSPLGEPESKKIGFVAPIVASAEISKPLICYPNMVQPMSQQDKNEMVENIEQMVHLKYPF